MRFRTRAAVLTVISVVLPPTVVAVASPLHEAALHRELIGFSLGMLPLALALGVFVGWRIVRPLEALRDDVLARARGKTSGVDISIEREDEVGELATAFGALLATLDGRSAAHRAFVADIVHELKNPVAAIRAATEALGKDDDPARRERVARILSGATTRLDALLSELLTLSRVESGMPDEVRERVDLSELVEEAIVMAAARAWGAAISAEIAPHLAVEGVALRLASVVENLLENAASFAGARGNVRVSLRADPVSVQLTIEDDGPGIPPAELPRVFDRFFTTRGETRGTGLGLALVRAIVEGHGGSVEARSGLASSTSPGAGAVFVVSFPRAR